VRVTAAALENFGNEIKSWRLIPSRGGVFELTVNGKLLYSKKQTGEHTTPEAIVAMLQTELNQLSKT